MKHCFPTTLSKRDARDAAVDNKQEIVDAIGGNIGLRPIGPGHRGLMLGETDRSKYGNFRPRRERPATHGNSAMPAVIFDHEIAPA